MMGWELFRHIAHMGCNTILEIKTIYRPCTRKDKPSVKQRFFLSLKQLDAECFLLRNVTHKEKKTIGQLMLIGYMCTSFI